MLGFAKNAALALALAAPVAHATIINTFTSRAAFDATVGATTLETFNSYVTTTPFHTVPVDVGPFTLSMNGTPSTATPRNSIDPPPPQFGAFGIDGTTHVNVLTTTSASLFLTFDAPTFVFGADFAAFNDSFQRTQIIADGQTLSPPVQPGDVLQFYGFESDTAFSQIEFRGLANDGFSMDNVSFGAAAVPEPGTVALMGLGMLGLMRLRRAA